MGDYRPTIGLEVHAELKTATKMFCNSKNDPDEGRPNVNVCPVCMAFPGTLPVVNRVAVGHVLKVGAAVGGTLADYTEFDRKNYFYPDLPKGYQISQYEYPLVKGGTLAGVQLTRIHLEEDTANSKHVGDSSIVDFNRAGIPLMELVTEPVIHDATTASTFAKELQLLLRTLGVGEANMEKGQMRVEANISISKTETFGTKIEVKNLNSFKSVERAIEFEIKRQTEVLESGGTLVQETRGFDEDRGVTFSQRIKESSHDYRYFPDPDIPKFRLSLIDAYTGDAMYRSLPELPWQTRARLLAQGITREAAEIILSDHIYAEIYAVAVEPIENTDERNVAANYLFGPIRGMNPSHQELRNLEKQLGTTAAIVVAGGMSSTAGIRVLEEVIKTGKDPNQIIDEKGLRLVTDIDAIQKIVEQVLAENENVVRDLKAGKQEAIQYLIGQGMKLSHGSAKPELLRKAILSKFN